MMDDFFGILWCCIMLGIACLFGFALYGCATLVGNVVG